MIINPYLFGSLGSKISFGLRNNMYGMGDSMTLGQAASPTTVNGYWYRLQTAWIGSGGTNVGVSGKGVWRALDQFLGATYSISGTIITEMTGFNDAWRGDSPTGTQNPKTLKKIEAYTRCIIGKTIINSSQASGGSTVTRTGTTFVNFNADAQGGVYQGTGTIPAQVATRIPASNTGTWATTFTGDGCCVAFIASDGVVAPYGVAEVWINGVQVDNISTEGWADGISDGTYAGQYIPLWFTYHGYGSGTHTIEVRKPDVYGSVTLDFISNVNDPGSSSNTLLVGSTIPHMTSTGYATQGGGSDAWSDILSAKKREIFQLYFDRGYNHLRFVDVNLWYHTTNINADGIHPDTTGHLEIFNAFNSVYAV